MPRHTDNLLKLADALQATSSGLTLQEIEQRFAVSHSSARRLLEGARDYFGNVIEVESAGDGRAKRWRMLPGTTNHLVAFEPGELVELDRAVARLRVAGIPDGATALENLRRKLNLLTAQRAQALQRPRLEDLMQLEQDVMRAGPRPDLPAGLLETLRQALLERRVIKLRYNARFSGRNRRLVLEPHGILFGTRHYLVAFERGEKAAGPMLYAMTNMSEVTVTLSRFRRRKGFDLANFAARSFGVFQEEPFDVVWRFAERRAVDALQHHFHLTQQKRTLDDGSVEVSFTAGGILEMCWHLFTWGGDVEVIEPAKLRLAYETELEAALSRLRPPPGIGS